MIDYLNGILDYKSSDEIIVETGGIGYKVFIPVSTFSKLPESGSVVKIYIVEAAAGMYGGVISLYGFLTKEERDMYLLIKDEVPGTGAKKAMEYTDKVSKSFADFKTAVMAKNASMLNDIFGFTKKTADKLIAALKDKISGVNVSGAEKWHEASKTLGNPAVSEAVLALISLGYKESEARNAANAAYANSENISIEELIKKSLKYIGSI
ncbi:MAG: Holliday junction branch migration protein RuvA [Endomicrobia bacterium]|nr:Holliday junction branch migration protein RuvA [Endomicrobiia bacterium]MCL2799996.1 Holliday junction branch migration protein RuvA [Endomicrobiia bacterium]